MEPVPCIISYTKTPWTVERDRGNGQAVITTEARDIAKCEMYFGDGDANAERIVACVNALAGLNPAAVPELEQKCGRLVTAIERYRADKGEPAESARFLDVEFATREARAALAKARQS